MTYEQFSASTSETSPPPGLNPLLLALWYDAHGDWNQSHTVAQDIETTEGSWIHAYLHRKEGDESNAHYWYRKAGKKFPLVSLEEEWKVIVQSLLAVGHDGTRTINS